MQGPNYIAAINNRWSRADLREVFKGSTIEILFFQTALLSIFISLEIASNTTLYLLLELILSKSGVAVGFDKLEILTPIITGIGFPLGLFLTVHYVRLCERVALLEGDRMGSEESVLFRLKSK